MCIFSKLSGLCFYAIYRPTRQPMPTTKLIESFQMQSDPTQPDPCPNSTCICRYGALQRKFLDEIRIYEIATY